MGDSFKSKLKNVLKRNTFLRDKVLPKYDQARNQQFQKERNRMLHKEGYALMNAMTEAFARTDLKVFCAYGTLLGFVRDQGFIAHDDDIDMGILVDESFSWEKVEEVMKGLGIPIEHSFTLHAGNHCGNHPESCEELNGRDEENTGRKHDEMHSGRYEQSHVKEPSVYHGFPLPDGQITEQTYNWKNVTIDFFLYYPDADGVHCFWFSQEKGKKLTAADPWIVFTEHFYEIGRIDCRTVHDTKVLIPENAESYLENVYGPGWKVPDPDYQGDEIDELIPGAVGEFHDLR